MQDPQSVDERPTNKQPTDHASRCKANMDMRRSQAAWDEGPAPRRCRGGPNVPASTPAGADASATANNGARQPAVGTSLTGHMPRPQVYLAFRSFPTWLWNIANRETFLMLLLDDWRFTCVSNLTTRTQAGVRVTANFVPYAGISWSISTHSCASMVHY